MIHDNKVTPFPVSSILRDQAIEQDPGKLLFMLGIVIGQAVERGGKSIPPESFSDFFSAYVGELGVRGAISIYPFLEIGSCPACGAGGIPLNLKESGQKLLAAARACDGLFDFVCH
jgi:hypothetical protein